MRKDYVLLGWRVWNRDRVEGYSRTSSKRAHDTYRWICFRRPLQPAIRLAEVQRGRMSFTDAPVVRRYPMSTGIFCVRTRLEVAGI